MTTKLADNKGRITLGPKFAKRYVIIKTIDPTTVMIKMAAVIPQEEAWLFENQEALASVKRGLKQSASGKLSKKPPNIKADRKLVEQMAD